MIRAAALAMAAILLVAAGEAKRSGYQDMGSQARAMQDDDAANPAFLWVGQGEALWNAAPNPDAKSCAGCHGTAEISMHGVAARYPAFDAAAGRPVTLEGRIAQCRERQGLAPDGPDAEPMLALAAFVGLQSRGLPIAVAAEGPARPFLEEGRRLFEMRMGQLNLSCAQCHDQLAGQRLGGTVIPQGQPTGYPVYRLEWQGMGSLYRRLRNCLTGVRSEPFAAGDPSLANLMLYLGWRANGLKMETPAVRP